MLKKISKLLFGAPRTLPEYTFVGVDGRPRVAKHRKWRMFWFKSRTLFLALLFLPSFASAQTHRGQRVRAYIDNLQRGAFGELAVSEQHAEVAILFPYGFVSQIATITYTGSGSSRAANGMQYLNTGTSASSRSRLSSRKRAHYLPGQGQIWEGTAILAAPVANSTQAFGSVDETLDDGYGFGYDGEAFGLFTLKDGVALWVNTSTWNVDRMDGSGPSGMTLNPQKGNVYKIQYQWLGFGGIRYFIEDPRTGDWQLVHLIEYSNANTTPSSLNPSLPITYWIENHANTSDMEMAMGSSAILHEGVSRDLSTMFSSTTLEGLTTAEEPIISLRSTDTFRGIENRISMSLTHISIINQSGTNSMRFSIYKNNTLTGSIFVQASADSSIDVDGAATALSGGNIIFPIALSAASTYNEHVENMNINIEPGDILTVAGRTFSGTGNVTVGVRWKEIY